VLVDAAFGVLRYKLTPNLGWGELPNRVILS